LRALRYWQSAASSSNPRIEQYRELVSELESEISGLLEGSEDPNRARRTVGRAVA
jgi:hypothetical protein